MGHQNFTFKPLYPVAVSSLCGYVESWSIKTYTSLDMFEIVLSKIMEVP